MLSRQIDDVDGGKHYSDGADRLEKRMSLQGGEKLSVQLDDFLKDPSVLMHKLSVDSKRRSDSVDQVDDEPIIFAPKVGLKRSTATHYRRGSLRRGERVGPKRSMTKSDADLEENSSSVHYGEFRLERVLTEPIQSPRVNLNPSTSVEQHIPRDDPAPPPSLPNKHNPTPSNTRRSSSPKGAVQTRSSERSPVPKIVETPPVTEHPERHSSFEPPVLKKISVKPDTGNAVEHRKDKKRADSSTGSIRDRKTSWGWLLGDSDKDKEKEEKKEREREEKLKAKKEKRPKTADKADKYDNTRLDLLQKSIEMGNTGKVVAADPAAPSVDTGKLESRKSRSSEEKKEGFLSFFGSSRKKTSDNSSDKKGRTSSRGTSPDPPHEKQQPYYYCRFPIHIERAIYRLSHLKLANPRRPLHQQVLLSNFMYSYLAKVQQTQPHLIQQATVSQSQQQKQAQAEQQRQEQQWQQQQQQQHHQAGQNGHYYYEDDSRDQSTEYVDDSPDETSRPHWRQAQYDSRDREHHAKQDQRASEHRATNSGGGNGGHHSEIYGNGNGKGGSRDEDMW